MSNNKQSSIDWLQAIELERDLILADWNKAKAMHKDEIIHSFNKGCKIGVDVGSNHDYHEGYNSEQYYNETFNTKEK